jgi:ABC-type uncharacterized transport system YnjBCD substrate-binding protein
MPLLKSKQMKKAIVFILLTLFFVATKAQAPDFKWTVSDTDNDTMFFVKVNGKSSLDIQVQWLEFDASTAKLDIWLCMVDKATKDTVPTYISSVSLDHSSPLILGVDTTYTARIKATDFNYDLIGFYLRKNGLTGGTLITRIRR